MNKEKELKEEIMLKILGSITSYNPNKNSMICLGNGGSWINKSELSEIIDIVFQKGRTQALKEVKEKIEKMEDTHCCFTDWRNNGKRIWVKELLSQIEGNNE